MDKDKHHDPGFLGPGHHRLNVIQIMCDQLPHYALGCYGHPLVQTPNIDGLAARGVLCTNAYGQNPVCCPSRASMLSGLYPANHGVLSNLNNLELMNPLVQLLSDRFYDAGYATAHFGKWHCLRRAADCRWTEFKFLEESVPVWPQGDIEALYRRPEDPSFVRYGGVVHAATHPCAQENTGPARITDYSIDYLERFAYKPFFFRVSYLAPHTPVLVPGPWDTMYDPEDIELPDYDVEEFANRPQVVRDFQMHCLQRRAQNLDGLTAEQAIRAHVAYSLGLTSHVDDQIGRLLRRVRELGLEENTVIMFTTDHGSFWGEHGLLEKSGATLYRNLLQLPLIVSCPGTIPQGVRYDGLIEEVDFYPTLLDLAGVAVEHKVNGRSFKDVMLTGKGEGRAEVFAEYMRYGYHTASLRDEHWNFIWHGATSEAELYDLEVDPNERFNLAGEAGYADVVDEWTRRLLSRTMMNRDVDMLPPDPEISRSPIYLTPGRDERGHIEASIRMGRGESGVDWWPMEGSS